MKLDSRAVILNVARAHLWVQEVGANRGQAVEAILKRVHLPPGNPWCAAFVSYVGHAVLRELWPLPLVGGCATLGEAAQKLGMLREEPANGAVFLLWSDKQERFNHTGFVTSVPSSLPYGTVEGNTSPDGSPEGTGVFERQRTRKPRDRFVWWWDLP